jgi:hypothetical protein
MMKVVVGYPNATEEHAIVDRALRPADQVRSMLGPADLIGMQERARGRSTSIPPSSTTPSAW